MAAGAGELTGAHSRRGVERTSTKLVVRWTIGDVSRAGFEALRLSIAGALRCFGDSASYIVCVNGVSLPEMRRRVGILPQCVELRSVVREDIPHWVRERLDSSLTQGTAWKLAPLRVRDSVHELALDNDCILWRIPEAVQRWLDDPDPAARLVAEDVRACFGRFARLCGDGPRNSGVRGIGPAFDLEGALQHVLDLQPGPMTTELDEQGLQIAALSLDRAPHVVTVDEVTICSPVPPHRPYLGRAGAHFVGLNARRPWCEVNGRPITELVQEHWAKLQQEVIARVGADSEAAAC